MFLMLTVNMLKKTRIIYFKGVNFILCELYLNKAVIKKKEKKEMKAIQEKMPTKSFSVFLGKESTWIMRKRKLDYYLSFEY